MEAVNIQTIDKSKLIDDHSDYLFQFAMSKIHNRDLALDLVQDTFLASLEKLNQFEGRSSIRTWMTTILNRKIIDHWRKDKKHSDTDLSDANGEIVMNKYSNSPLSPEQISLEEEKKSILELCIDHLPENYREIVHAKYYDEKNGEEISKEFNITSSNFWVIIHRAKAQLRNCMDKRYLS